MELSLLLLYFVYCARAAVTFSNVHSRLAFLPKTLFMRLVYSGFNEAQDNATKRQENVVVLLAFIYPKASSEDETDKKKEKAASSNRYKKAFSFFTTTSSFMTLWNSMKQAFFFLQLEKLLTLSLSVIVFDGQSYSVVYFPRQRDLLL